MRLSLSLASYPEASFNPRICKRCDKPASLKRDITAVSIHASVKDATTIDARTLTNKNVSIHASVKDATNVNAYQRYLELFQSTHL